MKFLHTLYDQPFSSFKLALCCALNTFSLVHFYALFRFLR